MISASDLSPEPVPVVRRRIKPIADSDTDDDAQIKAAVDSILPSSVDNSNENSNSSTSSEFTAKEKQLKILMNEFPDLDTMVCQSKQFFI